MASFRILCQLRKNPWIFENLWKGGGNPRNIPLWGNFRVHRCWTQYSILMKDCLQKNRSRILFTLSYHVFRKFPRKFFWFENGGRRGKSFFPDLNEDESLHQQNGNCFGISLYLWCSKTSLSKLFRQATIKRDCFWLLVAFSFFIPKHLDPFC